MTKVTRRSDDEAGATVVETPHAPSTDGAEERDEPSNDGDSNPLAETPWGAPARVAKARLFGWAASLLQIIGKGAES